MLKYSTIVVWYNHNKKQFYYKKYRLFFDKKEGFVNQYNHEVILVIDLHGIYYKTPVKNRLIKRTIRFLEKIEKN